MKKIFVSFLLIVCMLFAFALTACGNNSGSEQPTVTPPSDSEDQPQDPILPPSDSEDQPQDPILPEIPNEPTESSSNTLVVYFSATSNTERVAGYVADLTGGTLFELIPVNPYSGADLDYTNRNSRVYREYLDESLRDIALVSTDVDNWGSYDTVFIGYPIWWGIAAWPVNNFVKDNDFTGKTVIPFATSASSGMGQSGTLLAEMADTGDWQEGQRFSSGASLSTVQSWLSGVNRNFAYKSN